MRQHSTQTHRNILRSIPFHRSVKYFEKKEMKLKRLSILRLSQPKTYSSSKSSTTKKKKRVKEVADTEVSPSSSSEKQSSANENSNSKSIINTMDIKATPTPTTSNTNTTPPPSSSIISSRFHLQNAQVPQRKALIIHHSNSPKLSKETLSKYGKITQFSVPSNSSIYVAYSSEKNAQYAKRELSVSQKDLRVEEAVLKYCQHFLRGQDCKDLNCLYLHEEICRSCSPQKKQKQNNKPLSSVKTRAQQQTEVINSFVLEQSSISLGNINNDSDKSVSRKLFPTNSSFDRSIGPPNKDKTTAASFSDKTIHSPWQICSPIMIIQEQRQDNTLNKNQKGTPVINKREQPPLTPIPTPKPTPVSKSKEVTESTKKKKQLNEHYNSTMMSPSHTYNSNNLNQTQQILHHHHHPHHHMNTHKPVSYPHHPHTHSHTTYWNANTNTTRQQYPQQGYYHHSHRQSYHATQHAACYYNTNNTSTRGAGGGYHTVYQTQQPQPQPQQQWR